MLIADLDTSVSGMQPRLIEEVRARWIVAEVRWDVRALGAAATVQNDHPIASATRLGLAQLLWLYPCRYLIYTTRPSPTDESVTRSRAAGRKAAAR